MNPVKIQRLAFLMYRYRMPVFPKFISLCIRLFFSCYLSEKSELPKDLVLGYGGLGIVLHERVVMGKRCHIDQGVTIGGTSRRYGVPNLGDDVYVGAGAKVLGDISIGSNVIIGANAVVVNDVPSNCVVVGVPARVIKKGVYKNQYV